MTKLETAKLIYKDQGDCCSHKIICQDCPLHEFDDDYCNSPPNQMMIKIQAWFFENGYSKKDLFKTKFYVKDAVSIVKWLVDNGYTVDKFGTWFKSFDKILFENTMFQYCGTKVNEKDGYLWLPEWLEEREE